MTLEALLLDLDGTLVDRDGALLRWAGARARAAGLDAAEAAEVALRALEDDRRSASSAPDRAHGRRGDAGPALPAPAGDADQPRADEDVAAGQVRRAGAPEERAGEPARAPEPDLERGPAPPGGAVERQRPAGDDDRPRGAVGVGAGGLELEGRAPALQERTGAGEAPAPLEVVGRVSSVDGAGQRSEEDEGQEPAHGAAPREARANRTSTAPEGRPSPTPLTAVPVAETQRSG